MSIFVPVNRCKTSECFHILLTLSNKKGRSFIIAKFMEFSNCKLMFRSSEYPFQLKSPVFKAFFKESSMFLIINELSIPVRDIYCNDLRNLLLLYLNPVLNFLNDPVTLDSSDIRLKIDDGSNFFY
jgi:hypothetical protein